MPPAPIFAPSVVTGLDVTGDALELLLRDEGAELGFGIEAVADPDLAGDVAHAGDDLVEDVLVSEEAGSGAAALALVEEDGGGGSGDGGGHVGIGEDDGGRSCRRARA